VLILIKLLFVAFGCAVMFLSKYIHYKLVKPKSSMYVVTDKETYMKVSRKLIFIVGIYYVIVSLPYLAGFENIFFIISIPLVPPILLVITNNDLKKYYKRIEP
jgi:hypothetical protein